MEIFSVGRIHVAARVKNCREFSVGRNLWCISLCSRPIRLAIIIAYVQAQQKIVPSKRYPNKHTGSIVRQSMEN